MGNKVLILGGGFAGVEAIICLRKEKLEVTRISNRDYLYVYPASIWIPVKKIEFKDVCVSMSVLEKTHGFTWIKEEIPEIKAKEGIVICKNKTFSNYDHLIIAMGAGKRKGYKEHLNILCVMDSGDGAAFVYRNETKEILFPLPIIGH